MATKVTNPHFPHQCIIYRYKGVTSFNPKGTIEEIYNGVCRKESSDNIRTFDAGSSTTGKVDMADIRVSFPGIIKGIQKGDFIDVTDLISTDKEMRIVQVTATLCQKTEVVDSDGNRKTIVGGTAVLCKSSSN